MAGKHVNPHQFRMFIPAHELMGFTAGDAENNEQEEYSEAYGLLEQKRRHNTQAMEGEPLIKSVAREGVLKPVSIVEKFALRPLAARTGEIVDGHHRIVAAYDTDPNMEIPVKNLR